MSWAAKPLGELSRPRQWPILSKDQMVEAGFPLFSANGQIGFAATFTHDRPTVLVGCRGSCGTVHLTPPKAYANGNAMALDDLDDSRIDARFLYWFLKQRGFSDVISGSSQPQITRQNIVRVEVPLPPLDEQRQIAAILDQGDGLRRLRRDAVERLDALAQSTFETIIGDPVRNPNGWAEDRSLADVADIGSGVTKGRKLNGKVTRTVPYLAVANVQDRRLNLSNIKTIEATEQEIERYRLQPDDLLLTEGGDPDKLGRGALWTGEIADAIHQNHIFRVRLRSNDVHPVFLNWLIGSRRGKQYFLRAAKQTTGIASINMGQLKKFPLLIPPTDVQKRFAKAIRAIEQTKVEHSLHLQRLDALFASLQHRAFRGELTGGLAERALAGVN